MRILLATNSAATRTSYGIVSREIWSRIVAARPDFEVVQHGWFHHPVEEVPWEIYPTKNPNVNADHEGHLPDVPDIYGAESFPSVVGQVRPDVVWGLGDPWMLETPAKLKAQGGYKYVFYCPVDSEPYTPRWGDMMAQADELVAMTDYGKEVLAEIPQLRGRQISVIPHGVDLQVFSQADKAMRARYREDIGGGHIDENTFVLGWIGKDQYRKQVWQLYEMMYYLHSGDYLNCSDCGRITVMEYDPNKRAPRDRNRLRLYGSRYHYQHCWHCGSKNIRKASPRKDIVLWSHMRNSPALGYDLQHLAYVYKIDGSIFDASQCSDDRGLPVQAINYIYNCMDALIFPTGGEGFGLPVLEAMACGVPVIYADYSGHASFIKGGLPVRTRIFPEVRTQRFRAMCDMNDLIAQVLRLADDKNLRHQLSRQGVKAAAKMDWDAYTEDWIRVLERAHTSKSSQSIGDVI